MIGWIIFGAILLLVFVILRLIATVVIDYNGELLVKLSVCGIKIFTYPKPRKQRSKAKSEQKKCFENDKKSDEENDFSDDLNSGNDEKCCQNDDQKKDENNKKSKPSIKEIIDIAKMVFESLGKPLKKMLKRVSISHLAITAVCGGENAAKAAINYGTANYLLGVFLNLADEWLTLKEPDRLKIDVDFQSEETKVDFYTEIRLTVGSALAFGFTFLFRAVKYSMSHKEAKSALYKLIGK